MQRINLAKNCLDQHMAKGSGGEVGGWPWQHGWPSASTALSVVANCPSLSLFSADVLIRVRPDSGAAACRVCRKLPVTIDGMSK